VRRLADKEDRGSRRGGGGGWDLSAGDLAGSSGPSNERAALKFREPRDDALLWGEEPPRTCTRHFGFRRIRASRRPFLGA